MGVKMGWIQIKMGHPLARNGAALAPFRANGAHPSLAAIQGFPRCACVDLFGPQIAKFTKAWIDPGSTINFAGGF